MNYQGNAKSLKKKKNESMCRTKKKKKKKIVGPLAEKLIGPSSTKGELRKLCRIRTFLLEDTKEGGTDAEGALYL